MFRLILVAVIALFISGITNADALRSTVGSSYSVAVASSGTNGHTIKNKYKYSKKHKHHKKKKKKHRKKSDKCEAYGKKKWASAGYKKDQYWGNKTSGKGDCDDDPHKPVSP